MLKAVKVRIYPTDAQSVTLARHFGCARWLWNHCLSVMTATYKTTGKGISAFTMKKQIPLLKAEHEWLKECYSQCLQQSVLNLSQAFQSFFAGRAQYPKFKSKHRRQSIQFPQNVSLLSDAAIKFPGSLGVVVAKIHRPIEGTLKTVTVSRNPDGKYFASLLVEDGTAKPELSSEGKAIGIDLGLTDFAITSDGSKFPNPRPLKKL
ncbi:RNA-guided endonuclease TnpB family protein [Spirulina major CS-329]|nr:MULTISPECIES: RNA-guided endonuclease TnpB family protein [Spirulina]MDB9496085.1 RNA-guided endonuclease TnpB family protein [Spirulina subsalsa CS-330]MDB9503594.1 RNA-guided endonuclease TnpB family protein [Spirulina major CS-329]